MGALADVMGHCDEVLSSPDRFDVKKEAKSIYSQISGFVEQPKSGLAMFRGTVNGLPAYTKDDALSDIERLRGKISLEMERREFELERARLDAAARGAVVTVTANNDNRSVAESSSSASASAESSVEAAMAAIERSGLSDADKSALRDAIDLISAKAARKDEKGFAEKLSGALDIAGKAAGLVPAVAKAAGAIADLF